MARLRRACSPFNRLDADVFIGAGADVPSTWNRKFRADSSPPTKPMTTPIEASPFTICSFWHRRTTLDALIYLTIVILTGL
jgi:hypothetical protein